MVISEPILEEIAEVLTRPRIKGKYGISEADIKELLIMYRRTRRACFAFGRYYCLSCNQMTND
ncbi:hypothetical protein KsCSTR_27750 [Candidatus Kuenenia stuttgartiensis]|uniref:Uncharacterized protein n=1 Tax=Kuenenia stuttgartiensis TaxID=174633 RepID=Q1Q0P7_KUEST|nr:PIN domain-containing protein [Candidatus Kuenenia stuttgartiensis]MBW7941539.1 hypothetical protein [Candidatus Kuenenia stuttgartiensis]MBZ0190269.1 hypothetical protein [Candidatus Kuenenia stuttgartiensis]MCL4726726.1 hypothetical protein [Candidatus Kuenenia stuttgartiensis]QII12154.1 hypothetical protein KsCSTR_27750 [Candidatus Kuenenia stuttgartiensis]CAJ73573.1 unknown protein [Candidatus Kuenenia stuttgartiensis]